MLLLAMVTLGNGKENVYGTGGISSREGISRLTQAWGTLVIAGSLITCRTHLNFNATRKGDYEAFVTPSVQCRIWQILTCSTLYHAWP
jgi:hypothetical protein